jgi:hypothetical protein
MEKTWKPTVAGILSIIDGIFGLVLGLALLLVGGILQTYPWLMWGYSLELETAALIAFVGIITIILGIVAIVGGAFAIRRRIWGLALAGAICSFLAPTGFILGILSIIWVAMSKKEFV